MVLVRLLTLQLLKQEHHAITLDVIAGGKIDGKPNIIAIPSAV